MLNPKKSLGQNFLIDRNICKKIINLNNLQNKNIIEIGPGTGLLTEEIIKKKPKILILIEKDKNLFNDLLIKYKAYNHIFIYNKDALDFNFHKLEFNNFILIANLPYNVSVKIILKLISAKDKFLKLILMVQREVAEKIDFQYKKNNRLKFIIEANAKLKIEFNISNNVFYPKPKVRSSIIRLVPNKNKINIKKLEKFAFNIFNQKRKKLSNNHLFKNKIINNINLSERAEDIKSTKLLELFNSL